MHGEKEYEIGKEWKIKGKLSEIFNLYNGGLFAQKP